MFNRLAEMLGIAGKKDEALSKRFATMRRRYTEPGRDDTGVNHTLSGFHNRHVVGGMERNTQEQLNRSLIEALANKSPEKELELVAK